MNQTMDTALWWKEWLQKPLPGQRYGQLQSLLTGSGVSFHDHRRYQPGDARKHINRKLSAKHQHRYVNTQEHERMSELYLLLDINANRAGGGTQLWSRTIVAWLADLALVTQAYHTKVHVTFPTTQAGTLVTYTLRTLPQWGSAISDILTSIHAVSHEYQTAFPQYLEQCAHFTKQRLMILVSDFLDQEAQAPARAFFEEKHMTVPVRLEVPLVWTAQGTWWTQYMVSHLGGTDMFVLS